MPAIVPATPAELDDLIVRNLTDTLQNQNTAARVRQVLHALNASMVNRLTDTASTGTTAVFTGAEAATGTLTWQLPAGASTNPADYQLVLIMK